MNTERLNSWLTLGANIGVFIGIVFLALEVRQTGDALHAQIADSVADGFITLNMATISDPQVANVWLTGIYQPDSLTDTEAVQFSMYMRALFNQYIRLENLYRVGLISESDWSYLAEGIVTMMSTPGGHVFFEGNKLPPIFNESIEPYRDEKREIDFSLGRRAPPSQ